MFRAVGRFFRAVGYLLTGRVDRARQALSTSHDRAATCEVVATSLEAGAIAYVFGPCGFVKAVVGDRSLEIDDSDRGLNASDRIACIVAIIGTNIWAGASMWSARLTVFRGVTRRFEEFGFLFFFCTFFTYT